VVYQSSESGRAEVYVRPFPGPGRRCQISAAGGVNPRWRKDGREILYLAPDKKILSAEVHGVGAKFEVGAVKPLFEIRPQVRGWDITADGQKFLVNTVAEQTEPSITLLVNWTETLAKSQ
jgi:hypothetical protein